MIAKLADTVRHPLQASTLGALGLYLLFSGLGRLIIDLGRLSGMAGILIILVGLFIWYTGLVGLIGFAFLTFRASANGRRRVPTITADEFRSLWSKRFMAFATVVAAAGMGWSRLALAAGSPLIEIAALIIALLLPAALSLMLLNDSLWQALSPLHQLRMVKDMGWPYLYLPLALAAAATLVALVVAKGWPWPAGALLWGYGVMLAVHLCGATVYRYHERIGFEPTNEQLTQEAQRQAQQHAAREAQMDVAFALSNTDSARALDALAALFSSDNSTLATREEVLATVRHWPNKMVGLRLSQELIARHLALGNEARALALTLESLAQNPAFRPASPEATLRLATLAGSNGRPRVVTALLSDFSRRFPEHPERDAAALNCARVALEKTGEPALAREQLLVLERSTALALDPRVVRLREALEHS